MQRTEENSKSSINAVRRSSHHAARVRSLRASGCTSGVPRVGSANTPPNLQLLFHLCSISISLPQSALFFFATLSSLLATSVFRWPSCVIRHMAFAHGDKEAAFPVCVWPAEQMCPVTDTPTRWSAPWRARSKLCTSLQYKCKLIYHGD